MSSLLEDQGFGGNLDPHDWRPVREQAHRMLDDMLDYVEHIRERPVWRPIPNEVRAQFRSLMPTTSTDLTSVHDEFMRCILPYATGNTHPGFMGWVHGGGNIAGALAEMLAAGLNANLGGRDHVPIEVEKQIVEWMRQIFRFPETASGIFVTGTSMANLMGLLIARTARLGIDVRRYGVAAGPARLVAYASSAAHGCIAQAMDLSGLGTQQLRSIPIDGRYQIQLEDLERAIATDRKAGFLPFAVIGTAGAVDTGAIDNLAGIAKIARRENLWFHVDGAFGALAVLARDLAPLFAGIEEADSIAFDFHKWTQVPYDAGFILVRDGTAHRNTFASPASYLGREKRGLAAGDIWPCDLGPDLSRGFRALKTWFTLKVYGGEAIGAVISRSCKLAHYLEGRIAASPKLELLAPVTLNVVCFRYRNEDADRLNAEIVVDLHEAGTVAPSTTTIGGRLAIRAAIVNHRTDKRDVDALFEAVIARGDALKHARVA